MFDIPDKGTGANDLQSILFSEYLDVLVAAIDGKDCVLSGGAVTAQGTPDMTVAVAKAAVLTNGVLKAVAAANGTITTADGSNPRLDLVVITSSGAIAVRAGTAAAAPKPPARTANDVVLAVVYVPAADTTIAANQITDLRVMRTQGPILIDKVTTPVIHNTTLAIQTYYSLVLPAGLFLAGKIIRFSFGGTILANSGTPTWTYTLSYGGTTLYQDVIETGFTADTDRRVWYLEAVLVAQGDADQQLQVFANPGNVSAFTGPATGIGNLNGGGATTAMYAGSSAVDSDAADRTFTLEMTMSVSNANVETTMEYATAVLA